jgi:UDP-glucuronate decarboxylase
VRILVTGGAGFLGSHLCEALLNQGHNVYCLDNLYTGSKENISHLLSDVKFDFIPHDVTFPIYLEVDGIFNLACPASPIQYHRNPVQTLKTSVHGAINLLGLAKRTKARILQASTSEIYGDPEVSPQAESYWGRVNPIGVRSCYDEGKRAAETLFFDTHRQFGTDIRVARIFNTYGPRMDPKDGRVVSNFIMQALQNEDITMYGNGDQTRSFCYVDDLIDALVESYQGKYSILKGYKNYPIEDYKDTTTTINYLKDLCEKVEELRGCCKESYIQSQIDLVCELINSTLYKMRFLK